MSNPKISIIIPVYKVEKYLRRCLDSIINQTFTDWECILIDDGSPDNSGKICDEYAQKDERFRVIHQENAGVSAARNTGLNCAKGEWIGFVDSDDWIEKEMLSEMVSFGNNKELDIVICGYKLTGNIKERCLLPFDYDLNYWVDNFHSGTRIVKTTYLRENKIYFPEKITLAEDWWYNYQLYIYNPKQEIINKPFYNYFQNSESVMHSLSKKNITDAIEITKRADAFHNKNIELVNNRKIICKNQILTYLGDVKLWRATFPEINRYMWNQSGLKGKIKMLIIYLHFDFVIKFLYKQNKSE